MTARDPHPPRRGATAAAAALALGWLLLAGVLLALLGEQALPWLVLAVAVAVPPGMAWGAALLARRSDELRREAQRLSAAADVLRKAAEASSRASAAPVAPPPRPAPAEPLRLAARTAPPAEAPPRAAPAAPAAPPPEPRQESLPMRIEGDAIQVPLADLTRALDFPESAADEEGFRALRIALRDPRSRRLVQASQDVLNLLSEDSIYMDDLPPDRARPELWRRFAGGERGAAIGSIGGIRDRSSLALTAARMRADPVFRDAAHHFLRLFDTSLAQIVPEASDAELVRLTDTRTARAFMLVGRVAGIFE